MTSYLPLLKPSSASMRSRCVRLECRTATEWWACFNEWATRSALIFVRQKIKHAVKIRPLEQRHEQIELLLGRHRINRVRDGLGRRTPHSDFDCFRIAQNPGGEPFDLWRQSGREQKRLPIPRNFFDDSTHVGQKTHVEHAIDFIEHKNLNIAEVQSSLFQMIEQPSRCSDHHIDPALEIFLLFSVADTTMYDRYLKFSKTPVVAKCGLDLRRELARRFQHETAKVSVMCE